MYIYTNHAVLKSENNEETITKYIHIYICTNPFFTIYIALDNAYGYVFNFGKSLTLDKLM